MGGRAAGVDRAHTFFIAEKSLLPTSHISAPNICLAAGSVPPNIGPHSRRDFCNKKLPFVFFLLFYVFEITTIFCHNIFIIFHKKKTNFLPFVFFYFYIRIIKKASKIKVYKHKGNFFEAP
ncbi:MAG: hypothetical protein ACRC5F_04810 [Cetobacterium sp.]